MPLPPEYYANKLKEIQPKPIAASPSGVSSPTPSPAPAPSAPANFSIDPANPYSNFVGNKAQNANSTPLIIPGTTPSQIVPPVRITDDITPEEQAVKFGGAVGSPEYYEYKAKQYESPVTVSASPVATGPGIGLPGGPQLNVSGAFLRQLASAAGVEFPDEITWDKMSTASKAATVSWYSTVAAAKMISAAPIEAAKAPIRYGLSLYQAGRAFYDNEITGSNFGEAIQSTAEKTPFNVPILGNVPTYWKTYDDAIKSGIGPLAAATITGTTAVGDISIGASIANDLKGSFTPRGVLKEGEAVGNTAPLKQIIETDAKGRTNVIQGKESTSEYYGLTKTSAKKYGGNTNNTVMKFTPTGDGNIQVDVVQLQKGLPAAKTFVKNQFGIPTQVIEGKFGPEVKLYSEIIPDTRVIGEAKPVADFGGPEVVNPLPSSNKIQPIPPTALGGMENKLITTDQVTNLGTIGNVNGLDPSLSSAVIRTLTGKGAVGELSQAEYVNVAQTLAKMNNVDKFNPLLSGDNFLSRKASPTRYWTQGVEETTGMPVHSKGYVPVETAMRLAKVSEQAQLGTLLDNPIIAKFLDPKYAQERRLVRSYRLGDTAAITENPKLTPEIKAELIQAAGIFDEYYAKIGPDVGVPPEIFLDKYSPGVNDIGGKFQLYKETGNIPGASEFFAKQKKTGSLSAQIDDEWALSQIYTRAGYKAKYLDPVLKGINEFKDQLPEATKNRFASYVQEKLGYGGALEKTLDEVARNINNKLGLNLPPDFARILTNQAMNTMYSSAMSQPATWVRNAFQYPTMGYAYYGAKFMPEAIKSVLFGDGLKRFMDSGFAVDLGVPFGSELTQDIALPGKLNNAYRDVTQTILKPNSIAETRNRAFLFEQTRMHFEDAIAKYNEGKLTWSQAEEAMKLNDLGPVDRKMVREDLASGDMKGAFEKLVNSVIDETQFPMRRGASNQVSYGMTGHITGAFMQWPTEYFHTLKKWLTDATQKRGTGGSFDKIVRLYGMNSLILRTAGEQFGVDFSKSMGNLLNPITSVSLSPPIKALVSGVSAFSNWVNNNEQALQQNMDDLSRQSKLLMPAGVEINNWRTFTDAYKKGVDAEGLYGVYDTHGKLKYKATFADIFLQAFGFPTVEKANVTKKAADINNASFEYSKHKSEALDLYAEGKTDEANALVTKYSIKLSGQDFVPYGINGKPLLDRLYGNLPTALKGQFAPQVYPQTTQ